MKAAWALAALALAAGPAAAQTADAEAGADIATRWCGICHVVGEDAGAGRPSDAAPPLVTVARMHDASFLRGFLTRPHGNMPQLDLTTREIEQIIAYLATLR